jgi:methylmalonyl-CoA mutase N-terminal domain/subunit
VDSSEQIVVGVNKFTVDEDLDVKLLEIDESVEKKQIERLKKLRRERDNEKVKQMLDRVREVARSDENIMPVLIETVKTYATVGEITDALRDVFGEYKEPVLI